MNKRKAFTLLELLVVLIIVGVLSSIAIPNLWRQVERSTKAAEALNTIGIIMRSMDAHGPMIVANPSASIADIYNMIGMDDPSSKPDSRFIYTFWYAPSSNPPQYGVIAQDKEDTNNRIIFNRNLASYGEGLFEGMDFN